VSAGALVAPMVTAASVAPAVRASAAALLPQRLDLMLMQAPSFDCDRPPVPIPIPRQRRMFTG
jgi:hypothetical protein